MRNRRPPPQLLLAPIHPACSPGRADELVTAKCLTAPYNLWAVRGLFSDDGPYILSVLYRTHTATNAGHLLTHLMHGSSTGRDYCPVMPGCSSPVGWLPGSTVAECPFCTFPRSGGSALSGDWVDNADVRRQLQAKDHPSNLETCSRSQAGPQRCAAGLRDSLNCPSRGRHTRCSNCMLSKVGCLCCSALLLSVTLAHGGQR